MISKRNSYFSAQYNMPETEIKKTKEHPDLYKKVIKGGFWVFALRIFTQLMSMLRLVILARVLGPSNIGILGIGLLVTSTLETFTQTGFGPALIHKKKDVLPFLDTVWTLNIIRGLLIFVIVQIIAPLSTLMPQIPTGEEQTVVNVVRAMGLCVLIGGFRNSGTILFQKELAFEKLFLLDSLTNIINIVVSILIAITYKTVWALVIGRVLSSIFNTFYTFYLHSYKPALKIDISKARELWSFGKWINGSTILGFLMTHGDDWFIAFYLGPVALGFYQMAYKISNIPATEITHLINKITFPAYSAINNDIKRLKAAYIKVLTLNTLFSIPIGIFIAIFAFDFSQIFLGLEWQGISVCIIILSFFGIIRSIGATRGPLFQSLGKLQIGFFSKCIRIIFMAALIYPITKKYGINGTAALITTIALLIQIYGLYFVQKSISLKISDMLKYIQPYILTSFSVGLLTILLRFYLLTPISNFKIILCIIFYISSYVGIILIIQKKVIVKVIRKLVVKNGKG